MNNKGFTLVFHAQFENSKSLTVFQHLREHTVKFLAHRRQQCSIVIFDRSSFWQKYYSSDFYTKENKNFKQPS